MKKQLPLVEDPATGAAVRAHWVKAIITYRNVYNLQVGLPMLMWLQKEGHTLMGYYARYTNTPFRLELQLWTEKTNRELFKAIQSYRFQNVHPKGIRFEECSGSMAHAQAFNAVQMLVLEGKLTMQMLQDISHWMYNMAGFSYIQEAAATAASAYFACRGVAGWSEQPVFGTKLVAKANERTAKPRKALRRIKA